jgi:uncharacterized repeat protein (TIGR01451 family)
MATLFGKDRRWRQWLLIAAATVLLSACQAPDALVSQSVPAQAPVPAESLAEAPTTATDYDAGIRALPSTADIALSDKASAPPAMNDARVTPAQHTTPALESDRSTGAPAIVDASEAARIPATPQAVFDNTGGPQPQSVTQVIPQSSAPCPCHAQPYDPRCIPMPAVPPQPWCPDSLPCSGWRPPGLSCPWPDDEYLCDGGDQIPSVQVRKDWSVDGLQLEDTVVHYDTLDGDTHVEPSNRVCIYAPRFASVRKVYGVIQYDHLDRIARVDQPVPLEGVEDSQGPTTTLQPLQPMLNQGLAQASGFREQTPPIGLDNRQGLVGLHGNQLPYEDVTDLQRRLLTNSEKARLADLLQAAAVWSQDAAVQVMIDNIMTHEQVATTGVGTIQIYSLQGKPRLRVCKLASTQQARPGEEVEFTLQFENVGDQTIGNVTVIDNLTTRLEYVEDSQTCSLKANFASSDNQGDSSVLRWEIVEPMKVGEGGVIRFKCLVR